MTCQGETYSGEQKGLGQNNTTLQCGMSPNAGNTLIDITANAFSLKMKLTGSPTNPVVGAQIYNDSGVLQATSTNTIADLDGTFTFRQFDFASNFTVTQDYFYVIYLVSGTVSDQNRVDIQMKSGTADNNVTKLNDSGVWSTNSSPCAICFSEAAAAGPLLPPPPLVARF